jgi:hypothetical protein
MDLPPLESFEEAQPETYYLGTDKQFAELADAAFLIEGRLLPVHIPVLAAHSRVLRAAAVARAGIDAGNTANTANTDDNPASPSAISQASSFEELHLPKVRSATSHAWLRRSRKGTQRLRSAFYLLLCSCTAVRFMQQRLLQSAQQFIKHCCTALLYRTTPPWRKHSGQAHTKSLL